MPQLKILVFGDVVGKIGRHGLIAALPKLKAELGPDLVVANAENLAHGRGLTPNTIKELSDAGVDAFTSGQHVWENPTGLPLLNDSNSHIVRPANVDPKLAGVGFIKLDIRGHEVILLNLQGQLFLTAETSSPFLTFDRLWSDWTRNGDIPTVIVDLHAEATSEKLAFANHVDGRAALVYGTHTHVPTADVKILPNGTGYQTDSGMVGALDSVIGFEKNSSIKRFLELTEAPYKLEETGKVEINGLLATLDTDTSKTFKLERIREILDI